MLRALLSKLAVHPLDALLLDEVTVREEHLLLCRRLVTNLDHERRLVEGQNVLVVE